MRANIPIHVADLIFFYLLKAISKDKDHRFEHVESMRIKKPLHKADDLPYEKPTTLDLDPTTNAQLHLNIWQKLKEKIEFHKNRKTTPLVDYFTKNISLDDGMYDDNISKERTFGQDMRRLISLVCKAFLNPCESNIMQDFSGI